MKSILVHRLNLFNPEPKAIRCIAWDKSILRLAVSRSDSSIEIWNLLGNPCLEKIIPGVYVSSIETLVWCNGRLLSAGLSGYIIEYDLVDLCPKYELIATSGCSIWCMSTNSQNTCLAIGNEDGHVALYDFTKEGLDFNKKFDKQEGCILCLAWHKNGEVIVTGGVDVIRVWNTKTGHVINRIILPRATFHTSTYIWCISVLSDMTIISGDSCGKVSFWDGNTTTLISLTSVHKDDILCLCVTEDEKGVYVSGVDPIILMVEKYEQKGEWIKSTQRIVHTHDVRALQIVGDFLASGGDDCSLIFTKFPPKTTVKYFPFCQVRYAEVASAASCVLLRYPNHIDVWKIGDTSEGAPPVHLVQLKAKSSEAILCSSISHDGQWIAYSSQLQTKLFHIGMNTETTKPPTITKILLPEEVSGQSQTLTFFPRSNTLALYSNRKFLIMECCNEEAKLKSVIQCDSENVSLIDVSTNGKYLAVAAHDGNVFVHNIESKEILCKLPRHHCKPTALKFNNDSYLLLVVYSDRYLIEYDVKTEAYTKWCTGQSFRNFQSASFHPIISIVYQKNHLYLQDENSIYVFDKSKDIEPPKKLKTQQKLKQHEASGSQCEFKIVNKYENISSIHSFTDDDLVVVQVPSISIDKALPPPIWKKKFGM